MITPSATDALVQAARVTGEPGGFFTTADISGGPGAPGKQELTRQILPQLEGSGYIQPVTSSYGETWLITDEGYDLAFKVVGGKGLL